MDHSASDQTIKNQLALLQCLLNKQADIYSEIEEKMVQKQHVLVEGNPDKLVSTDQVLTGLAQKIARLEEERIALLIKMGHPNESLKEVIETLPSGEAESLSQCRNRLVKGIERVKGENDKARSLLNLSIRWVEDTVELIANALAPEAGSYNASGVKNNRAIQEASGPLAPSTIQRDA